LALKVDKAWYADVSRISTGLQEEEEDAQLLLKPDFEPVLVESSKSET